MTLITIYLAIEFEYNIRIINELISKNIDISKINLIS